MARGGSNTWLKLAVFALMLLCVYNTWQIRSLNSELSRKARQTPTSSNMKQPNVSNSLLAQAKNHMEVAMKYVTKGDGKRAETEIQKSLFLMEKAGKDVAEPSKGALEKLRQSVEDVHRKVDRLQRAWNKDEKTSGAQ